MIFTCPFILSHINTFIHNRTLLSCPSIRYHTYTRAMIMSFHTLSHIYTRYDHVLPYAITHINVLLPCPSIRYNTYTRTIIMSFHAHMPIECAQCNSRNLVSEMSRIRLQTVIIFLSRVYQ